MASTTASSRRTRESVATPVRKRTPATSTQRAVSSPDHTITAVRILIIALIALVPILVVPAAVASIAAVKMSLVYVCGGIAVLALAVRRAFMPTLPISVSAPMVAGVAIIVAMVLAGIFSQHPAISFFGRDIAQDTVLAIALFVAIAAATAYVFRDAAWSLYAYSALLIAGVVTSLVHVLHVSIPALPSFGFFSAPTITTLGKWNDLGLFAGLVLIMSLVAQATLTLAGRTRWVVYASLVLSALVAVLVNMTLVWWLVGIGSLIIMVAAYMHTKTNERTRSVLVVAASTFVLAVVFLAFGKVIGAPISNLFGIQHLEVRPSLTMTLDIAQQSLAGARTIVGVGPALFEQQWALVRPESVLPTNFWNLDFRYGFGFMPTMLVTTGLLGALAWVGMLGVLLLITVRVVRLRVTAAHDRFLLMAGALGTWFLWATLMLYLPSASLIVLTFIVTGLFLGAAARHGAFAHTTREMKRGTLRTIARIICVLAILATLALGVKVIAKVVAHTYFQRSVVAVAQAEDVTRALTYVRTAARLDPIDSYYQSLGQLEGVALQRLVLNASDAQPVDPAIFGAVANRAIQYYTDALTYDRRNHTNYTAFADFYTMLAAYGVDGVYDSAKRLYSDSLTYKPKNPAVYLGIARLELANKNIPAARVAIEEAVKLKPNYTDAYLLLTQIELSQNNRTRALDVLKRAGAQNPNDPFIYFQIGLLAYEMEVTDDAVLAFERALSLNPAFQNAAYFLGLSYYQAGETQSALRQFETLATQNPSVVELGTIVENLRAGRAPISSAASVETLDTLPLTDEEVDSEAEGVEAVE